MKKHLILGAAAALTLLVAIESARAQVRVRTGGPGETSVGVYVPGFAFQYGQPYYQSRFYYGPYRNSPYGYDFSPRYFDTYYYDSRGVRSYYYEPNNNYSYISSYPRWSMASSVAPSNYVQDISAHEITLRVIVPDPNARVWVGHQETQQRGHERVFVSPPVRPGNYTYKVRASWTENGRDVSQERIVPVSAGREAVVNFGERERIAGPRDKVSGPNADQVKTHEGRVVRAGEGELTMTDLAGQNRHTHIVMADAQITRDGTPCLLEELREGFHVIVTTRDDAMNTVVRIDATTAAQR